MSVEQLAKTIDLPYDPKLQLFAKLLITKCARIALANDDLFTMRDILEWYEAFTSEAYFTKEHNE